MGLINIFKFRNWAVNFELKYCYGTLRIWRSGPKVLNTEISVFGRLSVKGKVTNKGMGGGLTTPAGESEEHPICSSE